MEPYEFVEGRRKINKKKLIAALIVFFSIIALCVYSGIKAAEYSNQKKKEEVAKEEAEKQIEIQKEEEEKQKIAEEKRLEEEKKEDGKREKIVTNPFTEEQMHAVTKIYNSPDGEKRVFLTFDDGPTSSVTPLILDLLKKENIKASFFVLGNRAKSNPELIKREYAEGHYVANHGYTHTYSKIYQNAQTVLDEYNYTEKSIQDALNNPNYHSKIFRFPGGSNGGYYHKIKQEAKQLLRNNNIVNLDWNCLSKDAEGANTKEKLMQNVIDTAGSQKSLVILMHDAADKILTYETLPDIIKYLRDNGYTFKSLYDIL